MSKLEQLKVAKENVIWLIDHNDGLIDMHGLAYWASVVEKLREEIKRTL